jgi:hypothetical protein
MIDGDIKFSQAIALPLGGMGIMYRMEYIIISLS